MSSILTQPRGGAGSLRTTGLLRHGRAYTSTLSFFNVLVASLAMLLNVLSYESLAPAIVAAMFYGTTYAVLSLTSPTGVAELRMFNRVFSVGLLMAGIAAIYANQLQDPEQLSSDAGGFFEMATGDAIGYSLDQLRVIHEGSLAIVLWAAVYDFFAALGFERARYVGITVNVTAVALSGVIGIKMVRQLFGEDEYRFRRLILLVSACGLFWLFAGIHLRDSLVLLSVTALAYVWTRFITNPDIGWRFLQVALSSLLGSAFFAYFRQEFLFVPMSMFLAGMAALIVGSTKRNRLVLYALTALAGVIGVIVGTVFASELVLVLESGRDDYWDMAADQHGSGSLGMALILNQPMLIRLILGCIYLFVYPIPFWFGFQLEAAYHFFKSMNTIFFYFVLPLLFIVIRELMIQKSMRAPALLFMAFVALGFALVVAGTSLETRHFGAFLVPVFVLATVPDLRVPQHRRDYKVFLSVVLIGVLIVHLAWFALKS